MSKIAVVVLNWNGSSLLQQFLPAVVAHSEEASVYLVDNASTDDSVAYVKYNYPQVKIIPHGENLGFAGGYNQAMSQIDEPLLCLLNSDVEVTENWLQPITEQFEKEKQTAVIQPKIKQFHNKEYFEYAGAAGGFIDTYGFPFCRGRVFNTLEKDQNQYKTRNIFWASGACLFIRKSVFESLGGFDERFFAHMEEIDLCWRVFNQRLDVKFNPESTVYHVGGATLSESNPEKTFLNYRNSLLMLHKNLPANKKFSIIFQRLCLDGISGIRLMLQLKPAHCFAIVRSHFAFYGMYAQYKIRSENQRSDYAYVKSVVWEYFIRKRRLFSDMKKKKHTL